MMLNSRKYSSSAAFVDDFLMTLTPGIIPSESFIKWDLIDLKVERLKPALELYKRLQSLNDEKEMCLELSDSLLSADDPNPLILCGFELLGHTDSEIATKQEYIAIEDTANQILKGEQHASERVVKLLFDMGLGKVIIREELDDLLFGIQIGLETHRRKNVCGNCFSNEVKNLLSEIGKKIAMDLNKNIKIEKEVKIEFYHNGRKMGKNVDFGILVDDKVRFGVEINFYSSSGSKPTEIKRSYGNLLQDLSSVGVDLIWITDGKGYYHMQKSLGEAYAIVPNIYNYNQAKLHLAEDIVKYLDYVAKLDRSDPFFSSQ